MPEYTKKKIMNIAIVTSLIIIVSDILSLLNGIFGTTIAGMVLPVYWVLTYFVFKAYPKQKKEQEIFDKFIPPYYLFLAVLSLVFMIVLFLISVSK